MTTITTPTLEQLADRLIHVQLTLQPLRDEEAALKAQIRERLATKGPGKYEAGQHVISAQATRRLDAAALGKDYTPTEHPELYSLAIDTKKARAALPPAVVEQYMKVAGDMKIGLDQ